MCSFDVGAALTFEFNVERPAISARPKIGMAAQSGAMAAIMRMAFLSKGLGITFYISSGNEADLGVEDFLSALVDDDETKVIALFVEQVRKPQLFLEAARRARAAAKPVVLLLAGRSQRAQASARSHTGALAGDDATTTALLRHAAVNVVETMEELVDVTEPPARVKAARERPRHHHQFGRGERLRARFFRYDRLRRAPPCASHRRCTQEHPARLRLVREPGRHHRACAARREPLEQDRRRVARRSGRRGASACRWSPGR